ncbi:MAG: hypothetical protein GTN40_00895 [Candidatus Aenigmarchaeota archaeon]|nr:hypothetical protein [Candidatus Aenigmarchaeota archaeon]
MKFCFICGKKTENLINGHCEECYNKKFNLIEIPKDVLVTICSKCNRIKETNKWKDIEIDEFLRNKIKILGKNVKIRFEINDIARVYVKGFLEDSKNLKEEIHEVKLKIKKEVCLKCSRKYSDYYEALIQIRGSLTNDDINSIDDIVLMRKGFYRIKEVKGGYDFFISNKSLGEKITELLRKKYKTEIKKSFKLITSKEGKNIYRNIILIRILSD